MLEISLYTTTCYSQGGGLIRKHIFLREDNHIHKMFHVKVMLVKGKKGVARAEGESMLE